MRGGLAPGAYCSPWCGACRLFSSLHPRSALRTLLTHQSADCARLHPHTYTHTTHTQIHAPMFTRVCILTWNLSALFASTSRCCHASFPVGPLRMGLAQGEGAALASGFISAVAPPACCGSAAALAHGCGPPLAWARQRALPGLTLQPAKLYTL